MGLPGLREGLSGPDTWLGESDETSCAAPPSPPSRTLSSPGGSLARHCSLAPPSVPGGQEWVGGRVVGLVVGMSQQPGLFSFPLQAVGAAAGPFVAIGIPRPQIYDD